MRMQRIARATRKAAVFAVAVFVIAVAARLVTRGSTAFAGMELYYPSFCLGSWENPRAASGEPQIGEGSVLSDYTAANSAYLEPDVSSLIFCGYFSVEARERPPMSAKVAFRWSLDHEDPLRHVPVVPSASTQGAAPEQPADGAPAADLSSAVDAATENTQLFPEAPRAEDFDTSAELEPTPAAPPPSVDPASATPPSAEAPATSAEVVPAPPSESAAPPAAEPSAFNNLLRGIGHVLVPAASAQEGPQGFTDVLKVSYSFDGVRWHTVGKVSPTNWREFAVDVPVTSWDDLQNLQVMVMPLPSAIERPPIYLDAIELSVESDRTVSEIAADGAEAAVAVVDTVADAVGSLGDAIAGVFGADSNTGEGHIAAAAEATQHHAEVVAAAPPARRESLSFVRSGAAIPVSQSLEWYPEDFKKTFVPVEDLPEPSVSISDEGTGLTVSASCSRKYFVVLTYRSEKDYLEQPQKFASNYAGLCPGSSYTYTVSHLPTNTLEGTYFLLLAEQGEDGPWVPTSDLLPITITRVVIDSEGRAR